MGDLKAKLHGLDRLDAPDLWERATSIEPEGPDPDTSHKPGPRRLTAAVVSIALFIVAGAFAWTAFRPDTTPGVIPVSPASADGAILWPERTGADLQAVQLRADDGDASVAWRFDPKEVAIRFAEQVMGWGSPEGRYVAAKAPDDFPAGVVAYSLRRYAIPCPSPAPGAFSSTCPPPFEGESLVLQQKTTLGEGGIWSVTEVRATPLNLQVEPGEALKEESRIQGTLDIAPAVPSTTANAGVQIGTKGDCFIGASQPQEGDFSLPVRFPEGESCGSQPAYAWAATEPPGQLVGLTVPDPFSSSADKPRLLYGLTAVPFMVVTTPSTSAAVNSSPVPKKTSTATRNRALSDALGGTQWMLTAIDGRQWAVHGTHRVSILFDTLHPDRLGGYNGCNEYGAHWAIGARDLTLNGSQRLHVTRYGQTLRYCGGKSGWIEKRFTKVLQSDPTARLGTNELRLTSPQGVILVFSPM